MDNSTTETTTSRSTATAHPDPQEPTSTQTDDNGTAISSATPEESVNSTTAATKTTVDETPQQQKQQQEQQQEQPQTFAAAMGFNPPKLNTSGFFSSMQGKIQSTIASAKSPGLNLQPPQINKVDIKHIQASTEQLANTTKDWGVSAFKSFSSAAQRVSANVTQGIQKEHEDFLKQKKMETVVPHQGTGTDFVFDMNVYSSTATATLKLDPNLDKMRFYLVPKEVEELVFWRNYFYRVALLKQVALASASSTTDTLSEASSPEPSEAGKEGSNGDRHTRTLSVSSALGYNIYFGKDDVEASPTRSRPASMAVKDSDTPTISSSAVASVTAAAAVKDNSKTIVKKEPEVLFEAEMPDHDEDTDAWLDKQLASGVSIDGDDDGDMDVADWEKELQNELKDYVE
ncbi:Synapse-associated protein 1 [Mortierella polycephala]|uniref:Synapse-associated protein 1 n=1 Tax=Mortierella polycephala TaxID=41804 RepID=A0A9P6PZF3_9FUNG|nr:Synapse-associated protein 1 [Mortierella polycephala]